MNFYPNVDTLLNFCFQTIKPELCAAFSKISKLLTFNLFAWYYICNNILSFIRFYLMIASA